MRERNSCACQEAHGGVRAEELFSPGGRQRLNADVRSALLVPRFLDNVISPDKPAPDFAAHVVSIRKKPVAFHNTLGFLSFELLAAPLDSPLGAITCVSRG